MNDYEYTIWFEYQEKKLVPIHDKPDNAVEVSQILFQKEEDLNNFFNSFSEKGFLPSSIKKLLIGKQEYQGHKYIQIEKKFPFIIDENNLKKEYERFKVIRKMYGLHYEDWSIQKDKEYLFKLIYTVLVIQRNNWKKYFFDKEQNYYKQWFVQQITILMLLQNQRPTDRHLKAIIETAYTIKSYLIKALHLDRDIRNYLIEESIKQIDFIEASNLPKPLDDEYTKLKYMGDIKYVESIWDIMKTDYRQNPIIIVMNDQKIQDQ
ncbi:hypothetical protein pb186bvf_009238 [Paramecium bursaria]